MVRHPRGPREMSSTILGTLLYLVLPHSVLSPRAGRTLNHGPHVLPLGAVLEAEEELVCPHTLVYHRLQPPSRLVCIYRLLPHCGESTPAF